MIPNPTPDMLASQRRIRRRAARILEQHALPFPRAEVVLQQRPEIAAVRGAGVVVCEGLRWSA